MKRIRTIVIMALAGLIIPFVACDDEAKDIETMTSGFMTGQTDSKGHITILKDDFGKQYVVKETSDSLLPDTMIRVVTSIALDQNGAARILQVVRPMSYRAPEDSLINDTLKVKDPVQLYTAYIGGGYLNITLGVKVKKEMTMHMLGYSHLGTPTTSFTLYHNAYGDGDVYTKNAYISIPLSFYGLNKNDTVSFYYKSYEGDRVVKLAY